MDLAPALAFPPYPWQLAQWQQFTALFVSRLMPHAFIVSAQAGLGIEKFALAMGQFVLCAQPHESQVCGTCKACLLIKAGSHPDLKVVVPEEKSDQLKVDQVREVNHFLAQTSQQGAWKVVILEPAHAMNPNAANALLKNLEEPAERTLFILVTTQAQKILPTIRSRCRQLFIPPANIELATTWLTNSGVKNAQDLLAYLGNRPLEALDWYTQGRHDLQQKIISAVETFLDNKLAAGALAKHCSSVSATDLIAVLIRWLEGELRRASQQTESRRGLGLLFRFGDRLRQKRALLESTANINATLVVDEIILDLAAMARVKGLFNAA